jgi:aspartate kinase
MLIVQKYGGTSLGSPERLRHVARLCKERRDAGAELVVVVSAMGGETDSLTGRARELSAAPSARELDALITTGEQQAAALLVMTMEELGLPAVSLTGWQAGILSDNTYGDADIRLISPARVRLELSRGRVPVVTGFQGVCAAGDVTSLGRGGSDTTAVALSAALEADGCEIYTDVDGIYTADPRVLPDAKLLDTIDTRDMLAL